MSAVLIAGAGMVFACIAPRMRAGVDALDVRIQHPSPIVRHRSGVLCLSPLHPTSPSRCTLSPRPLAGACGGETACSTCHIYVSESFFKKLPELSEAEEDMLDLAAGLKGASRN